MKQIARIAILLAAVLITVGCTKISCWWPEDTVRDIVYTIDKNTTTVHLTSDAEFDALLDRFCDYAEGGSIVTFYNVSRAAKAAKEATTYSTTSREEMKAWMRRMEDAGMTVTVTYDPNTGTWNGTAYATVPHPPVGNGVATYVSPDLDGWGNGLNVIVTIDSLNRTAYVNFDYNNHWLHMPCGVFHDIHEEDGRLILAVWENQNGTDTLYIGRNYEDSLIIDYAYSGACFADHTHGSYLVPAPQDLQTWYCSSPYDIILGLYPYAIETYPEIGLAQICATMAENINCIPAFWTGTCEMQRYFTSRTDVDWELSLRYTYNNDSSYYIIDSLGVSGYPDNSQAALPMVIHDLHQYPSCAIQYVFQRIN